MVKFYLAQNECKQVYVAIGSLHNFGDNLKPVTGEKPCKHHVDLPTFIKTLFFSEEKTQNSEHIVWYELLHVWVNIHKM